MLPKADPAARSFIIIHVLCQKVQIIVEKEGRPPSFFSLLPQTAD